jgi:hypothetical protein
VLIGLKKDFAPVNKVDCHNKVEELEEVLD